MQDFHKISRPGRVTSNMGDVKETIGQLNSRMKINKVEQRFHKCWKQEIDLKNRKLEEIYSKDPESSVDTDSFTCQCSLT